ncbi:MAG: KxYKxGKxW signal peptide domain-containing protein, partial [Lactobacillus sp.]|nr:KxYKxGKxW signal peptide domain-containing protein [Lactobacillus sp.]
MEKKEIKVHFKMYKAGRQWLVAGIAAFGLGITVTTAGGQQVQASVNGSSVVLTKAAKTLLDEQPEPADTTKIQSENLDLTGSYYDVTNNFNANGDSSIEKIGDEATVVLTPDAERQSGNLTLNSQIDLNYDFDMTANISFGHGDGVSIGFHTGNTNQFGRNGGSLGFADLPNSFGWKADTYVNQYGGQNKNDTTADGIQYFGPDPTAHSKFGAFVSTDTTNHVTINTDAESAQGIDSSYNQLHVHYDAKSKTLTVELTKPAVKYDNAWWLNEEEDTKTWTEDISSLIPDDDLVSFFVAGATGDAYQEQSFQLKTFNYHAVGTLHVKYVDAEHPDAKPLAEKDIRGAIGTTIIAQDMDDYKNTIDKLAAEGYSPADPNTLIQEDIKANNSNPLVIPMVKKYSAKVKYLDIDNGNLSLSRETTISGKTGELDNFVDVKNTLDTLEAAGYEVTNPDLLKNFTFTPENNGQVFEYLLKHSHTTITPTQPNGHENDLTKTVTQTINYVYKNGDDAAKANTQTITFTRTGKVDDVTRDVVYTAWTAEGKDTWETVTSPTIDGYKPDTAEVTGVKADPEDKSITVTYKAQPDKAQVKFVDDDNNKKQVGTFDVDGVVDSTVPYNAKDKIPTGYELADDKQPVSGNVTIKPGDEDDVTIHLKHSHTTITPSQPGDHEKDLTKTVTQTINYVYENGDEAAKINTQTITFTRTGKVDDVTRDVVYTAWTAEGKDTWETVTSPTID